MSGVLLGCLQRHRVGCPGGLTVLRCLFLPHHLPACCLPACLSACVSACMRAYPVLGAGERCRLSHDPQRVEGVLLANQNLAHLVLLFRTAQHATFENVLAPYLEICSKSRRINRVA